MAEKINWGALTPRRHLRQHDDPTLKKNGTEEKYSIPLKCLMSLSSPSLFDGQTGWDWVFSKTQKAKHKRVLHEMDSMKIRKSESNMRR